MKSGLIFAGFFLLGVIFASFIVSAENNISCNSSDSGAYGKGNIFGEFVAKENFCIIIEWINSSQLNTKSNISSEGKEATEFGDGAAWYNKNQDSFLVRCSDNNCSSAKVNECEGKNCGLMMYRCLPSRLGGLSEADAIKYYLLHPIQFFRDYNTLFKKAWDKNQGFVKSTVVVDVRGIQEKYSDGAIVVRADKYSKCVNGKLIKSSEDLVIEKNESYCDVFPDKCN